MSDSCAIYKAILDSLQQSALAAGRSPDAISLLAVSKRQGVDAIRRVAECGQTAFGENYLQEAKVKIDALADLHLEWHFIGPLQSNKTTEVARLFDWVHTIDRLKIAERLNAARGPETKPLNVCIQVNISGESSKSGIAPSELRGFRESFRDFPNLKLRGLMALPAPEPDISKQRAAFKQLRDLYVEVFGEKIDTLSIGTSADYHAAILEGATIVRIGTALFGPRTESTI
ncbi:MAG: YggS family pyridoxal phosphate-dependent enzyme [Gammaproteobacteria bacterium]